MTEYIMDCPLTKKGLKALQGHEVTVISPGLMGDMILPHPISGAAIVGPGPYTRKWYAQIWTSPEGTLQKVS